MRVEMALLDFIQSLQCNDLRGLGFSTEIVGRIDKVKDGNNLRIKRRYHS